MEESLYGRGNSRGLVAIKDLLPYGTVLCLPFYRGCKARVHGELCCVVQVKGKGKGREGSN